MYKLKKIINALSDALSQSEDYQLNSIRMSDEFAQVLIEELKERDWIKCSDSMPEEQETMFAKFKGTDKWSPAMFERSSEDVRVVIVFSDGTRRVSHSHTVDGKWECEKSMVKRTVTHWMKNPEMPEEGAETDPESTGVDDRR